MHLQNKGEKKSASIGVFVAFIQSECLVWFRKKQMQKISEQNIDTVSNQRVSLFQFQRSENVVTCRKKVANEAMEKKLTVLEPTQP